VNSRILVLVKGLLTISIKVNSHPTAESQRTQGVTKMKKAKPSRGFWGWLCGEGWGSTGGNG
jgi:hypothetical protein